MSITITDLRDASRIRSYIGEIRDRNGGRNPHVDARLAEAEVFLARADAPLTATPAPTGLGIEVRQLRRGVDPSALDGEAALLDSSSLSCDARNVLPLKPGP